MTLETPQPEQFRQIERLLEHFSQLEVQFQQVREGLTHSHRLATLGTIASVIAHEYNNILTPVVSYGQMALANPDDHALLKTAVEKALNGAERAAKITSSLLGFAREADHEHAAVLRTAIQDALNCMARDPKRDGIELTVDVPDVQVAMTPLNLQQVLLNLMLNAMQAMRGRPGKLRVSGRVEGALLRLEVADTGPGIPRPIMDRLFEPFVTHRPQAPTAPGVTGTGKEGRGQTIDPGERKGTGLGLCICRDLLRNAGGSIRAESQPGQGATFHLTIPVADNLLDNPASGTQ